MNVSYPAPVIRYSGSVLHVSCDEAYPHSVSLVEIDKHGGEVQIEQLRIDELRHFYVLPEDNSSFTSAEEALDAIQKFCKEKQSGYIRLRISISTPLPSNFNQIVYDALAVTNDEVRYNPKIIWTDIDETVKEEKAKPSFEVAELQQMTNPLDFISKIIGQYPELDMEEIRLAFEEVEQEVLRIEEEEEIKAAAKETKKGSKAIKSETETDEE